MSETFDNQTGEIIPYATPLPAPLAVHQPFRRWDSDDGVYTNIPRTPEFLPLLVNASSAPDARAKQMLGKVLDVKFFYAHQVLRPAPAGQQPFLGWRCVLITNEGKLIACSGPAIIRAVEGIVSIYGKKPWEPPIACEIVSNPGSNNHDYHTLKIHPAPAPIARPIPPVRK